MSQDLVTVIIPTYKRAERLSNAINSVLNQTHKNVEIIIVDDNNEGDNFRLETIKTMEVFKSTPQVKYVQHKVNSNGATARNTGFAASKGDYICFLDDDDFFYPQKIEKQLQHLKENNIDALCVGYEFYNDKVIYKRSNYNKSTSNYVYDLLSGRIVFAAGSTLMVRRNVMIHLNGFDTSYIRHQDWEFLMRIFRQFKFGVLDECLVGINTDGIRNYPNPIRFKSTKEKFLLDFKDDIFALSSKQRKEIMSYQWSEIMVYFFRDKKILTGFKIYFNKIIIDNQKLQFTQLIKGGYYFLENYLKGLTKLKYLLFKK